MVSEKFPEVDLSGFLSGFFIRGAKGLLLGGQSSTRGVWGHVPLGNFGILGPFRLILERNSRLSSQ